MSPSSLLLDSLYCDEEGEVIQQHDYLEENMISSCCYFTPPLLLLSEQDLFWEDEELLSLFTKEKNQIIKNNEMLKTDLVLSLARHEAVEWILKVNTFYGFSTLTFILAINYLDRFLCSVHFQKDCNYSKPWMLQLVAVTCLSLAAKVEETQVPLLLDLQVEGTKYVFEARTIQKMELLVLSALQWRMQLVTPISFIDHIVRRLGLKTNLHWEFLRRCELLLVTLISATTTMIQVIDQLEPLNAIDYNNQLLGVLKISKEDVIECYKKIEEVNGCNTNNNNKKRKYEASSPNGVIEAATTTTNESWPNVGSFSSFKKSRSGGVQQTSLLYVNF
ncbi:hypothetical protein ACFE04_022998 [Oxalis oulophora]